MGMFAPMVGSLAKEDSEIGARMGICFTFNSQFILLFFRVLSGRCSVIIYLQVLGA